MEAQIRLLLLVAMAVVAGCATGGLAARSSQPGRLEGLRVALTHVDAHGNYTKLQLVRRAARRSRHRMSRLVARTTGVPMMSSKAAAAAGADLQVPVHAGNGEFLMDLSIGTPAVPYAAIIDTGSDLVWTQCKPCVECFNQSTPVFDPSSSSTYSALPCSSSFCADLPTSKCTTATKCGYTYTYGDSSSTQGVLAAETFTLAKEKLPGVAFGCGDTNEGEGFTQGAGLVGLGRGPLSLVSQLGLDKFSYCLTSLDDTSKSPLLLGSLAAISKTAASSVQTTPLVKNPSQPSFYYVNLKGLTVGSTHITLPSSAFSVQADGTGGVIVDSGTSITYLELQGYRALKKAFAAQMKLPAADGSGIGLDLCFAAPASGVDQVEVPKLVLHFDGGADLDLPAENYMVLDSGSGALCLTVMGSRGLSIIGNFQQQNIQFVYDVGGDTLSFAPVECAKL
ncbi:aspartic proteinase nepenthesin-1 [Lolium perenne]|uniref:aspartic proteinase nepenthesin-1 n=1 Tax=Lolium perenne TaxID=4522 RepID=UPI0021EAB0BA|nr:aspartic proteinase nepenthesin-1 [Lolium perenne]